VRQYVARGQAAGASNATINRDSITLKRMFTLEPQLQPAQTHDSHLAHWHWGTSSKTANFRHYAARYNGKRLGWRPGLRR